jgi:lipoate-protein ligase B
MEKDEMGIACRNGYRGNKKCIHSFGLKSQGKTTCHGLEDNIKIDFIEMEWSVLAHNRA